MVSFNIFTVNIYRTKVLNLQLKSDYISPKIKFTNRNKIAQQKQPIYFNCLLFKLHANFNTRSQIKYGT